MSRRSDFFGKKEVRVRAIQAVVELLRLLGKQWQFNSMGCQYNGGTTISYEITFIPGEKEEECPVPVDIEVIYVNLRYIRRKRWIVTSAEVYDLDYDQKDERGIPLPRAFRFEWAEGGRIARVTEVKLTTSQESYHWTCKQYDYPLDLWPLEQTESQA